MRKSEKLNVKEPLAPIQWNAIQWLLEKGPQKGAFACKVCPHLLCLAYSGDGGRNYLRHLLFSLPGVS